MKRLQLTSLAFALVVGAPYLGDVRLQAVYQQAWTSTSGDPSTGLTLSGITTSAGSTICAVAAANSFNTIGNADLVDNNSSTFTRIGNVFAPDTLTMAIFYAVNITGRSGHTITFTRGDANYAELHAVELTSMQSSSFDASATNTNQTGDPMTTTAATTTATDTLCAGFVVDTNSTFTAGSGFTIRGTAQARSILETKDSVASGSNAATATTGGSVGYGAIIAGFKESGGAACVPTLTLLGVGRC